jgi:hypothetical protein
MSPIHVCPFYGELSREEAELLKVPHGTSFEHVKMLRTIKRVERLIGVGAVAVVAVAVAVVVVVVVL